MTPNNPLFSSYNFEIEIRSKPIGLVGISINRHIIDHSSWLLFVAPDINKQAPDASLSHSDSRFE